MNDLSGFGWVAVGASVGAPARYLVDRFIQARHDTVMPWGTLTVNVVGCFALGVLAGLAAGHDLPSELMLAAGTGFCGALTTYSTFSYETLRLFEDGARLYSVANIALSVAVGYGAALAGYGLASLIG